MSRHRGPLSFSAWCRRSCASGMTISAGAFSTAQKHREVAGPHFSAIDTPLIARAHGVKTSKYKGASVGDTVDLDWETPRQDGFEYRAVVVTAGPAALTSAESVSGTRRLDAGVARRGTRPSLRGRRSRWHGAPSRTAVACSVYRPVNLMLRAAWSKSHEKNSSQAAAPALASAFPAL